MAIQVLLTTVMQMGYYDNILEFEDKSLADIQSFVTVLTPKSYGGLAAVTALFCVHIILTMITVAMFLGRTQYSMMGQVWQTILQMKSPATDTIFSMQPTASDDEVETLLTSEGRAKKPAIARVKNLGKVGRRGVGLLG